MTTTTLGGPGFQTIAVQSSTCTSNWTVNVSSTQSNLGDIFTNKFMATNTCSTTDIIYLENYNPNNIYMNTRYYYTIQNDTGGIIYDKIPGYMAGNNFNGTLYITGNLNVSKNIYVDGCISYNRTGVAVTLGVCL